MNGRSTVQQNPKINSEVLEELSLIGQLRSSFPTALAVSKIKPKSYSALSSGKDTEQLAFRKQNTANDS